MGYDCRLYIGTVIKVEHNSYYLGDVASMDLAKVEGGRVWDLISLSRETENANELIKNRLYFISMFAIGIYNEVNVDKSGHRLLAIPAKVVLEAMEKDQEIVNNRRMSTAVILLRSLMENVGVDLYCVIYVY